MKMVGKSFKKHIYLRSTPHPVTVTTRIITFLVGNPYKPSFATVTGWGVDPIYTPPKMMDFSMGDDCILKGVAGVSQIAMMKSLTSQSEPPC